MHCTVLRRVRQTGLTAADLVWCDKVATACSVTASVVVNYLYFAVIASVVNGDGYCRKLFDMNTYRVFENTLPKVSFTTAVTAIGMWGYTPVRTTGVLVCFLSPHADRHVVIPTS